MKSLFKKIKKVIFLKKAQYFLHQKIFQFFSFFSFKGLQSERGIALLMVLSALMVLSTTVVEFSYNSRINYRLAVTNKQKLQAYYLAKSALSFSKLLLKYQKQTQALLDKAGSAGAAFGSTPIYKMIPLSSEMIRGLISGDVDSLLSPTDATEETVNQDNQLFGENLDKREDDKLKNKGDVEGVDVKADTGLLAKEEAQKFLDFEGDFESEITEEASKFDLNKIASIEAKSAAADYRRKLLYSLLMLPAFEPYFKNQANQAQGLSVALADWVDSNDTINDFDKTERGSEGSLYDDPDLKVKNGKFLTLSEMRLVSGMNDDIYTLLQDYTTLYTNSAGINLCLGETDEDWAAAFVYFYTHFADCTSAIDYTDNDRMSELVTALLAGCPDPEAMASGLNVALGLADLEKTIDSGGGGGTAPVATGGSAVKECAFQVKDFLSKDNNVFHVKATGTVGEAVTTIDVVVNSESGDPSQWKYYYYRIE